MITKKKLIADFFRFTNRKKSLEFHLRDFLFGLQRGVSRRIGRRMNGPAAGEGPRRWHFKISVDDVAVDDVTEELNLHPKFVVMAQPHITISELGQLVAAQYAKNYPHHPPLAPIVRFRTIMDGTPYDLDTEWLVDRALANGQQLIAVCQTDGSTKRKRKRSLNSSQQVELYLFIFFILRFADLILCVVVGRHR